MRPTNMSSEALIRHVKWFLTTKLRRPFDYSKAHRFLLFILLKSNIGLKLLKTYDLAADLEYTLMNIDLLGMHYKVHILEFLKTHNRLPIIKKYIYALYGEDGTKIFLNENVVEMHQIFSPYGMLVAPDIMKAVSQKIKWNVVGYTGYKEYAMQGPSDCFELLTSMVLMEQIETHNARKIEGAIYSIYNLGKHFGEIFTVLSEKWSTYSDFQKDTLLVIIARWFFDQIDGLDHLREIVLLEYRNCSSLTRKYYLHSILTSDSKSDISASEAIYTPSSSNCDFPGTPSNVISRRVDRFLEFIEEWYDYPHMNDDLRICIKRSGCKENYGVDNFQKIGDCLLPAAIDEEDRILYSAEKDGRWVEIPLLQKKCWLLPSDDPYLLTEMPHMVFDDSWFPCISDSYGEKSDIRINKDQFSKIVHGNRPVGEIVLGACVWYPWNDDDGKLYIETAKIDTNTLSPYRSDKVDPCFGNYGLLAHEGALVEFGGDFAHINGASLFKVVGGNMFFYLCNSQIAPSEIWREGFKCVPDHTSPYCWRDENGNIVLRFERIASPIREAMHEKYYRQPILFRWLCNSEWLKETLCKHNLHLRYVSRLESIP